MAFEVSATACGTLVVRRVARQRALQRCHFVSPADVEVSTKRVSLWGRRVSKGNCRDDQQSKS
jgi:hypothetical protein